MIQATVQISSEGYYSCDVTRSIPVRVILVTINGPVGFGIIESLDGTEKPLKQYVRKMKRSKNVLNIETTYKSEEAYWTRAVHELGGQSIYETVLQCGCMTRLPIIIEGGVQNHVILAPSRKAFSELLKILRSRFEVVRIRRLRSTATTISQSTLTPKQVDAIRLAIRSGYYEIPRKSLLISLAKELGIKRVAMQERLRRAERAIITEFAEEHF
jgi:predicted DNA binding protein